MNLSQQTATAALNTIIAQFNSAVITIYSGVQPASPETALSGNTALVAGTYAATAFSAPTYVSPNMQSTASFTAASYAPTASGTATFARVVESGGTIVIADLTVGTSGTDIIIGSTSIATGTNVSFAQTAAIPAV